MIRVIIRYLVARYFVSQSHFNSLFIAQRLVLLRTLQRMADNPVPPKTPPMPHSGCSA
jgi:hypothetical protein